MAVISNRVLRTSLLLSYFATSVFGIIFNKVDIGLGINVKCPPAKIECPCGWNGEQVDIEVEQCSYFHRFKNKCKPCKGKTVESICSKYLSCAMCHADGGESCLRCPSNKFGDWCEYECTCNNGGYCDETGACICPNGYEGLQCEKRKGCRDPGRTTLPLKAEKNPPDFPLTIVYSCEPSYHLKGATISSCLPNGQWSKPPPKCLSKCPLLNAPASGRLIFGGSELVEGVTADFTCDPNHQLVGEKSIKCQSDGTWSSGVPKCDEISFCQDPGYVRHAKRTLPNEVMKRGSTFYQDTTLRFDCKPGFQQMGINSITCLQNGNWSSAMPICVKASSIIPDCETTGSDVVSAVGVAVRIVCPPECMNEHSNLWGTSIYRMDSAICPAAVHAGKITNSGGLVAIINNGEYTSFAGSQINSVQSEAYDGTDESFRFDKLPTLIRSREKDAGECPDGLIKLSQSCVLISTYPSPEKEAEAICTNFGLALSWPESKDDQRRLLLLLESQRVDQLWTGAMSMVMNTPLLAENETIAIANATEEEQPKCETMKISDSEFVQKYEDCPLYFHYVCIHKPSSRSLASCVAPGNLSNGAVNHVGKINDVFYVGSSIEYSCESLHYLKGARTIACRGNGTWSDEKPTCIKVDTCGEPPVPAAGYVEYMPPTTSPASRRMAIGRSGNPGMRMARLPVGMEAKPNSVNPRTGNPGPEIVFELPPGRHRIGTTAMYTCESRYYELIGSKARRCLEQGQWSGRPPTCMPICGRSDSPRTPFIVNGNASDIGQWPWQAGLARYIPDYNRWFLLCGGSLLTERWVITAAHCVTYAGTTLSIDPDKFRVYLGKYHRLDSKDDEFVQTKGIHEIHIHPDYDPGIFDADIALIQLESPVQLNSRVQPVCLPTERSMQDNLKSGTKGVVTGWGMNENESYSEILQQAVVPVVSNEECEKGYEESELPLSVTDNMFCAGYKEGKNDACSGDSGGPIVFADDSEKPRRWILEGIVSWGSPKGCGNADQYGGYTTVGKFLNWINLFF